MTETSEIKTAGINLMMTGTENAQPVLAVGLKEPYRDKPQHQKALQREYDKNHQLEHPHLMKYLAIKEIEHAGTCLLLQWEPARTLEAYIHEGHSVEEYKRVLRQIADAVNYLHENNMVHGALDAQNVFITNKGDDVRVLNFRMRYADNLHQPADSLKYIAPEAKDGTIALDARADIFSLGAMVKAMDLGPEYNDVVKGSCSYGRSERFDSTTAFIDAMEHRRPTSRKTVSSDQPASHASNKRMAVGIAILVAVVLGAIVWFFNGNNPTTGTAAEETTEVANTASDAQTPAPADSQPAPQDAAAEQPAPQEPSATATDPQYTGELAFLATLVPQMHIDIDKLYAKGGDSQAIRRRVVTYYKGLRGTLKGLSQTQYDAFDKAFADYVTTKNAAQ